MLLYALLHLTGYDLPIDELQQLPPARTRRRRAIRKCGVTPGVETTTGPLGQGLANARRHGARRAAARRASSTGPATTIVDHHTYVFVGDGCLMEGISHEACSLAGTLGLGKLIAFYDDNGISIDGEGRTAGSPTTRRSASRRTAGTSMPSVDGHDVDAVDARDRSAARREPTGRR